MYIRKINMKNWRSIGESPGASLDVGRINVLSGVNDSGKTAILLGLYGALCSFYYDHRDPFLKEFLHIDGSKHEKVSGEVIEECNFEIITSLSSKALSFIENKIRPIIADTIENQDVGDKVTEIALYHTTILYNIKNLNADPFITRGRFHFEDTIIETKKLLINYCNYTEEKATDITKRFNDFTFIPFDSELKFNIGSFYISPNRQYSISDQGSDGYKKNNDIVSLGYDISELVGFIKQIKTERVKRRGKYNELIRYVQILFPEITSLSINIPEGTENNDIYVEWQVNGHIKSQPLSRSGSGVVSAIYLASRLLCDANRSTIGFIDEPETSLHPKLQVRFVKLLRELSNDFGTQWLVTTHSPFIMKNLKDEDRLFLVEHDGTETRTRAIEPVNKSIVFQALGAYLPDSISSKGFIFVEGATENILLPILLEKCEFDVEKEGLVIIPLGGDNLYCIPPADFLKIHPKAMVILDSDLSKPQTSGGMVLKKKLDYEEECNKSGVHIYMSREYRTIENMYPKHHLANLLNISIEELDYGNFDKINKINDRNKLEIAKEMGELFTKEEALDFILIKEILKWWAS